MADQETVLINRPPRIQPDLPQAEIDIPEPPETDKGGQTLIQMFLPLITIIGYVIVSASGQGRNLAMLIPMGLSVIASSGLGLWTYLKQQREDKERRESYRQRLAELRREMENYHDLQRNFYAYNYPDPEITLAIAQNRELDKKDDRFGTRLWERRTSDEDFGTVRLGMGTQPSSVVYNMKMGKNNEDPLMYEAIKLADDSKYVQNIPVVMKLRPYKRSARDESPIPGRHSIGITGRDSARVYDAVRSMLVNFAVFHAPTDTRLLVFGAPSDENNWNWARYLPHCNTGGSKKAGDQLCFSPRQNEIENFWDVMIKGDLERRLIRLADDANAEVNLPLLLIVVDALSIEAPNAPTKNIDAQEAVSLIFRRGQELGATIIFLMPDAKYVPTQVETLIEIDPAPEGNGTLFRYTEIGVNTRRVIGMSDSLSAEQATEYVSLKLRGLSVRSTFGTAGLPTSVLLLNLHDHINAERIDASVDNIWERWKRSRDKEQAEWLRVPVGFMPGPKRREMVFSANGDGVHGMIAGTTGSGKSEMLITLILGLALRYDPSVINFVLVDFKGGTAFKMFERLPHVVNLVTSLQGNAGERTFIALEFEMKRRAKMLADAGVPHIVDYRSAGYHRPDQLPPGTKVKPQPFPFLFIIIDEFAEMVKEMPQFRPKLDSVTRLGRAYGVSLLLATQRPAGAVTDQMRANIKFKLCLRVETAEDSRELLRSSDAAFLPTGVPGRAYLMIGNDNAQLMQVAYGSYRYNPPSAKPEDEKPPVIKWLERPKKKEKKAATADDQKTVADRVVELCAQLALDKPDVVKQEKPWPDPLPVLLPLNAEYITSAMTKLPKVTDAFADEPEEDETIDDVIEYNPLLPINKALDVWLKGGDRWQPIDWESSSVMNAQMGLIDDPYNARQLPMMVDMKAGSIAVFGASGKGKTNFLRTLAITLATTHSPDALWIYALDFGGGGLTPLADLPHMGAIIGSEEGERVERLMNTLKEWLRARGDLFSGDSLTVYNKSHPNDVQPAVLVLIDNFAEFRSSYEDLIPDLMALIREGLSKGIYFAVTADQLSTVPGRLMSLFNQRLTLKLSDPTDYVGVVGRVPADLDDIAGRAYTPFEKKVLECQVALPVQVEVKDAEGNLLDASGQVAHVAGLMRTAWSGKRPKEIHKLESIISLADLLPSASDRRLEVMLGKERRDLSYVALNLKEQGPHFLILGSPFSGRTTTLRMFMLSLAAKYGPDRAAFILIDSQRRLFQYGEAEERTLTRIPHVRMAISEQNRDDIPMMMDALRQTYANREGGLPEIFIFVDNYDDFSDLMDRKLLPDFANMARRYGAEGLHVVVASGASASDELFKVITRSKYGLALDAESGGKAPFNITAMSKLAKLDLPVGRGFLISTGRFQMLQVSTPYPIESVEEMQDLQELNERIAVQLDEWVARIEAQWADVKPWQFPEVSAESRAAAASSGGTAGGSNGGGAKTASSATSGTPAAITPEFVAHLRAELKKIMPLPEAVDGMNVRELLSACIDFSPMVDMAASAQAVGANPNAIADALVQMGVKPEQANKVMGVTA
jgi:DNA segregation ATPase FtsK/SpoIIIE-like protein